MEFQVLGPVEIGVGDRALDAGHARQRAVLAVLLLDLGRVVPASRLIDRVWGEDPPPAVRNVLYGYIGRLRALLASSPDAGVTLSRRQAGYLLQADPKQLDLHRFRSLVTQATAAASDDETAEGLLRVALGQWHGPALAGVDSPWLNAMRDTLELERHAVVLDLNAVRLRLGQHAAIAAELVSQAAANPADERLIGQLMLALYRCGRQAEGLRWYEQTRRYLAEELGTDPAPQLQELHQQILHSDPALAAAATAATGKAGAPVPRELPPDVAAFTGRAAELAALDELLLGPSTTTAAVISAVSGTAGVGKTALAVRWAHSAAGDFPDGQLHVNLRGYDPEQPVTAFDALAGFLRSLGVPAQLIPAEETERAARYRSLLADKRVLIVLDNAATVEQVRPLLPSHAGCRVLVTSRDSLAGLIARDGARRLDLDLLPLDDAITLLHELIGAGADAEPATVAELAQECGRLPLALRIAAELAIARPAEPLARLVAELKDEQARLDLLHADGDPRTAVRAVFSWSYDQLSEEAARTFRRAGLHPGSDFDSYAVGALAGTTAADTRRILSVLTHAHLLEPARPGRYSMHDLLRVYARERAAALDSKDENRAALTRLLDSYLSTAASTMDTLYPALREFRPLIPPSAAPGPPVGNGDAAMAWLDAERSNLVAVTVHAADNGWPSHATQISATLLHYLQLGRYISDAVSIHNAAGRAARQAADPAAEAATLTAMGSIFRAQGRYQQATGQHRQALVLYRKAEDRTGEARTLHNLGLVEKQQGDYPRAAEHHQQALALFEETGNRTGQAMALNSLGNIALDLHRYEDAVTQLQQALVLSRETGYRPEEAIALGNLGIIAERLGRYEQAAEHYQQALMLFRETGDRLGEATALNNLGIVDYRLARYRQAADWQRKALSIACEVGDPAFEADFRIYLGEALLADGDLADAQREHTMALHLASQIGHRVHEAHAHDGLGRAYHASGNVSAALQHGRRALALYTQLGLPEADEVRAWVAPLDSDKNVEA